MGVGEVALSFVGVNGREERQLADQIRSDYGDRWQPEWLRFRGLGQWADYLQQSALEFRGGSLKCAKLVIVVSAILLAVELGNTPQVVHASMPPTPGRHSRSLRKSRSI